MLATDKSAGTEIGRWPLCLFWYRVEVRLYKECRQILVFILASHHMSCPQAHLVAQITSSWGQKPSGHLCAVCL